MVLGLKNIGISCKLQCLYIYWNSDPSFTTGTFPGSAWFDFLALKNHQFELIRFFFWSDFELTIDSKIG